LTSPYLVLHCEEFAWPRLLPSAPVRSYFKPASGPHRFTHHPLPSVMARWLVCSLLHLSSAIKPVGRPNLRVALLLPSR